MVNSQSGLFFSDVFSNEMLCSVMMEPVGESGLATDGFSGIISTTAPVKS